MQTGRDAGRRARVHYARPPKPRLDDVRNSLPRWFVHPLGDGAIALVAAMSGAAHAGSETLEQRMAHCRAVDDAAARLRCYDALAAPAGSARAGDVPSSIDTAPAPAGTLEAPPGSAGTNEAAPLSAGTIDAAPIPAGKIAPASRDVVGGSPGEPDTSRRDAPPAGVVAVDPAAAARGRTASDADKSANVNVFAADARCPASSPDAGDRSPLDTFWELGDKCGRFGIKTYRPNYLLFGRYSNSPDAQPTSPTHPSAPPQSARRTEAKFQLSFRFKLLEDLPLGGADVWGAYTQQSNWQVYDGANSRPFRETDYEPELMVVLPTRYDVPLFGWTGRYVSLGIVHQSNGQSDPLSRSWNRVYAQFGFDAGDFSLQVRPWVRLRESLASDDNPDIEHYLGHADFVASYRTGKFEASLLLRDNLHEHSNRGSAKLDLSFPAWPQHNLRFYLQAFAGYGETLIDYNHRQTTVGVGIMLDQ